jgi:hypothetical protein
MTTRTILTLTGADNMTLDGSLAQCWHIDLVSNVNSVRVKNMVAGVLYTVILEQDATGSHTFAWPPACINATAIDLAPLATTLQNFVGDTGGLLISHAPGTWNP